MDDLERYKKALEEEFEREQGEALAIFKNHEAEAAQKIIALIQHSENPHIRLKAAMYVLNSTVFAKKGDDDSLAEFLKEMEAK